MLKVEPEFCKSILNLLIIIHQFQYIFFSKLEKEESILIVNIKKGKLDDL
jgi:hypothetical protein